MIEPYLINRHSTLTAGRWRAALAGMSLSDYLLGEISEIAARPTLEEFAHAYRATPK